MFLFSSKLLTSVICQTDGRLHLVLTRISNGEQAVKSDIYQDGFTFMLQIL